jgi:hydrogenase maturation protease
LEAQGRKPAHILVFGYGNPARGDDALGPSLIERLEVRRGGGELEDVELLTDFQLQIEHALDLVGRRCVIFADAASWGPKPFAFGRVRPADVAGYTSHAMSPGAVLQVYGQVTGNAPPPTWLLAIRGFAFDLGEPLSDSAEANLRAAEVYLLEFMEQLGNPIEKG